MGHRFRKRSGTAFGAIGLVLLLSMLLAAQEGAPQPSPDSPQQTASDLSIEQGLLADRWERLEQIAERLAELTAASDPHRADLLRKALAQAREKEIHLRFETIVGLLQKERYNVATQNQESLEAELAQLLELLLKENRAEELRSQQEWLRMQLKEVNRIIRLQRGVKARTEGGDDSERLAEDQEKVGERTGQLAKTIEESRGGSPEGEVEAGEGSPSPSQDDAEQGEPKESEQGDQDPQQEKEAAEGAEADSQPKETEPQEAEGEQGESAEGSDPSKSDQGSSQESNQAQSQEGQPQQGQPQQGQPPEGQPQEGQPEGEGSDSEQPPSSDPDENLRRRLRAAEENMDRARQKLEEAERSGAAREQEQALRELEEARAELERILRQLREEEMERTLALLEARFRRMLEAQIDVYEGTVRLDRVPQDARDHDDEIEGGRLSRQEEAIVREADKALEILLEEGTSVAFPEAVTQMRTDMQDVAGRLAKMEVSERTQQIEEDIIEQLEESIEILQKALEDLEKNRTQPGQAPPPGEPQDPNLVDKIEELKMIRSLQQRINRRTQRYYEMIGGSGTDDPALLEALRGLAEREERVYEATRDLDLGRNE
jgi:hypothetical protein